MPSQSRFRSALFVHQLLLLLLTMPASVQGTPLAVACPAVNNEVPFYLDPSINTAGNTATINGPVGPCTTCSDPTSAYFANAGTPAPFNGAPIPAATYMAQVYGPSPGNNFALILLCPNACVCSAGGLCAQVTTPMTNFALYPFCSSKSLHYPPWRRVRSTFSADLVHNVLLRGEHAARQHCWRTTPGHNNVHERGDRLGTCRRL